MVSCRIGAWDVIIIVVCWCYQSPKVIDLNRFKLLQCCTLFIRCNYGLSYIWTILHQKIMILRVMNKTTTSKYYIYIKTDLYKIPTLSANFYLYNSILSILSRIPICKYHRDQSAFSACTGGGRVRVVIEEGTTGNSSNG